MSLFCAVLDKRRSVYLCFNTCTWSDTWNVSYIELRIWNQVSYHSLLEYMYYQKKRNDFFFVAVVRNFESYSLFFWRSKTRNAGVKSCTCHMCLISRRGAWKVCVWNTVALLDIIIHYEVLLIGSGNSEYPWIFTKTTNPKGRWRAVDIYLDASRLGIISTTIHLPFGR